MAADDRTVKLEMALSLVEKGRWAAIVKGLLRTLLFFSIS